MHITLSLSDTAIYCCQPALLFYSCWVSLSLSLSLSSLSLHLSPFPSPNEQRGRERKNLSIGDFPCTRFAAEAFADRNGRMQQDYLVKI